MRNLLVIGGQTATGKTAAAIAMARLLGTEVLSADSRQVYTLMNIGTGKDIPEGSPFFEFKKQNGMSIGYYLFDNVPVWGYDIVSPRSEFNVSRYQEYAKTVLDEIYKKSEWAVIVGGTGLYIKAVTDGLTETSIPPNEDIRKNLTSLSAHELYKKLQKEHPAYAAKLNESDSKNPRRLIRAFERAAFKGVPQKPALSFDRVVTIALQFPTAEALSQTIDRRITKRFAQGFEKEMAMLQQNDLLLGAPSSTVGYREWVGFMENAYSREHARALWKQAEIDYAKRQVTWFKKVPDVVWFEGGAPDTTSRISDFVKELL